MPSREQWMGALREADAAGNDADAQAIATIIREGRFDADPEDVPVVEEEVIPPQDTRLPGERRREARPIPSTPEVPEGVPDTRGQDAIDVIAEFAASANRSVTEFIDFVGPDTINAMLRLARSDQQMPTLTGALESAGIQGGFMEPGPARGAVQAAGTLATAGAGMVGVGARNLTNLPGAAAEFVGMGTQSPVRGVAHTATNLIPGVNTVPPSQRTIPDLPGGSSTELTPTEQLRNLQQSIAHKKGDVSTATTEMLPSGAIVPSPSGKKGIASGLSPGAVAMVKSAPPAATRKMVKMLDRLDAGLDNMRVRLTERPGDIVGNSLGERIRMVSNANKRAGKRLNVIAKELKGKTVDVSNPVNKFLFALEEKGISVKNGIPDFEGSDIEGLDEAQRIIKSLLKRTYRTREPDAYDVHRMKKFIDEQVNYGKEKGGLSGAMENVAKSLRHDLDGLLDTNFPDYKAVNDSYAETISVLNKMQDIAGKKIDLLGPNADSAIGTLARRLLSNAPSRVPLKNTLVELDKIANKYNVDKIDLDDDIIAQVGFVEELEKILGPSASTSLFGEVTKAVGGGSLEKVGVAEKAIKNVFGQNEKQKLQAIRELLESN